VRLHCMFLSLSLSLSHLRTSHCLESLQKRNEIASSWQLRLRDSSSPWWSEGKGRFIFHLCVFSMHRCVPAADYETAGFQFRRKANIVARPAESKIRFFTPSLSPFLSLSLSLSLLSGAYCTVRTVKRTVYGTKWSRMNRSTSDGCISQVSRQKAVTSSRN
jgi:hypothetical protein